MHGHRTRLVATLATTALLLAGCSNGDEAATPDGDAAPGTEQGADGDQEDLEGLLEDQQAAQDPSENIEDGVYRGQGVALPVPEGWSINPGALAQGAVVATPEDASQQFTAQAIDADALAAAGQDADLDALVESVRQQIPHEAEIDEEVELRGADQAHRLTYVDLPGQEDGAPSTSTTIVLASTDALIGEFTFAATTDIYDEQMADALLAGAGFDPDSEPPAPPPPQPAPEGQSGTAEEGGTQGS